MMSHEMGAGHLGPNMGAMKKIRKSIHDPEQQALREWLISKRKEAGLTQRQLAENLEVVHSLIGKVEKGERKLDVVEFSTYCHALNATPCDLFNSLELENIDDDTNSLAIN